MTPRQFNHLLVISALLFSVVFGMASFTNIGGIRTNSKNLSLDFYIRTSPFIGNEDLAKKMVLVAIDEASLKKLGQWPWPRVVTANLLDRINKAEPLVIGVDVLMTEKDRLSPQSIAELTQQPIGIFKGVVPDGDAVLAKTLARTPSVMATSLGGFNTGSEAFTPATVATIGGKADRLLTVTGILSPTLKIQTSPGAGFVSLSLKHDNRVRRIPIIAKAGGKIVPAFTLEMLRVAQSARGHVAKLAGESGGAITEIKTGDIITTADDQGFITLHHGYSTRFTTISAHIIMENNGTTDGENDWAEKIKGSFVILGSTATGLKDIHATVLEASLPGPYIHLQTIHQTLSGRTIHTSAIIETIELISTIIMASFMAILMMRLPLIFALASLAAIQAASIYGFIYAFKTEGYLGNVFLDVGIVTIIAMLVLAIRAIYEEYRRSKLRRAFNQYLSPEMVRRIDSSNTEPALGGKATDITVLFMDIEGFTTLAEALADDPATLTLMINQIMDTATAIVLDSGGTLDKYIGDALMAFWNAPIPQTQHASFAIEAAIKLVDAMPEINLELKKIVKERWPQKNIRIRIGLATGVAVVGNLGSRFRFNYSCIGDAVNLAARLEDFSKNTDLPITIAAETAAQSQHPDLIPIDTIIVRGKQHTTDIFSPVKLTAETREMHTSLIKARKNAKKKEINQLLRKLKARDDYPEGLIKYYQRSPQ